MIMLYKSTHKKIEKQNLTAQSASIEGALAPPLRITLSVKFFILKCFFIASIAWQNRNFIIRN